MQEKISYLTANDLAKILGNISVQAVYKYLKANKIETIEIGTKRIKIPPIGIKKILNERGFIFPQKNISFQIVKGGVGKTSLSYGFGIRASHYGAKVLLIDLDKQANLTRACGIQARDIPVWVNILKDNVSIKNTVSCLSDTLHIIPSNLNNSTLDLELTSSTENYKDYIRDVLLPIRHNYDIVVIDCPPDLNKITLCATCASDTVIIPINPDQYAMDGLDYTLFELKRIKNAYKLNFEFNIVWNQYDARERLTNTYVHDLAKDEEKIKSVLPVVIRSDSTLKNFVKASIPLFEMKKKSSVMEDFDQLTREILGINHWSNSIKKHDIP